MVDAFRSMLDELMGKDRDLPPEERKGRRARFYDPEVCKHALCGLCPYNLFFNTKSDLGGCEFELHEDHLDFDSCKEEWDALSQKEKDRYGYERQLLKILQRLVSDMDRKIEKQQERARLESQPKIPNPTQQAELDGIKQKIKELTDESAKLAEAGEIDASMAAVQQSERLEKDHERLHKKYTEPDRYIMVCEVCGVFIQSTDNEARRRDHIEGKQYLGWKAIREKCAELEEKLAGAPPGGGGHVGGREAAAGVGSGANAFPVSSGREHRGGGSRAEREEGEVRGDRFERPRSRDHERDERYGRPGRHSRGADGRGGGYERERGYDRGPRRDRERDRSYERRDRHRPGGAEVPPPQYRRSSGGYGGRGGYGDRRGNY